MKLVVRLAELGHRERDEETEAVLIAGTLGLTELPEVRDLAFEIANAVFVALEPPSIRLDFTEGRFVLDSADVQDFTTELQCRRQE